MPTKALKAEVAESKAEVFDIFDVSNYFINLSLESKIDRGISEGITNLKLQKILYFAQCAYLSLYDKELFSDEIVAWQYGPVVESVYHIYKKHINNILPLSKKYINSLPKEVSEFLDGIWEMFSKYSARELVNITHKHKPWNEAYHEGGSGSIIQKSVLRDYYKGIFKFQENE